MSTSSKRVIAIFKQTYFVCSIVYIWDMSITTYSFHDISVNKTWHYKNPFGASYFKHKNMKYEIPAIDFRSLCSIAMNMRLLDGETRDSTVNKKVLQEH